MEIVVRSAVASLSGGSRIDVNIEPAAALVVADTGLLERVVANLAANALSYAPSSTRVHVDASASGGRAVIRVVDTGPGVPPTERDRLFEPFQRLGDVPRGEGVGLGLAVARGLTEAMGGTLSAEDTPGGGLTFVVDLPLRVLDGAAE